MDAHENLIKNNSQKYYIGTVSKVRRQEGEEVEDYLGKNLAPFEILFNVGNIIENSRAIPLEINSEVSVGDKVVILSMENIYNSTYYYLPIRYTSKANKTIKCTYNNAALEFIPIDGSTTDIVMSNGKCLVILDDGKKSVHIKSGRGGIEINSNLGLVDIKNNNFCLNKLMDDFIDKVMKLKIMTPAGIGVVDTSSMDELLKTRNDFTGLLGKVSPSQHGAYVPLNTYNLSYVKDIAALSSKYVLEDEGGGESDSLTKELINGLPDEEVISNNQITEEIPLGDSPVILSTCDLDSRLLPSTRLSENFTLGDLTTKPTWPHLLRDYRGLKQEEIACNLKIVAENILEPMNAQFPGMRINSGFRAKPSISGKKSQHESGQAVDLQFVGFSNQDYYEASKWVRQNIVFDQFIFEHGNSIWFHISVRESNNRRRLLTMLNNNYTPGITLHY